MNKLICLSMVLAVATADGYYGSGFGGGFSGKRVVGVRIFGGKGINKDSLYGKNSLEAKVDTATF